MQSLREGFASCSYKVPESQHGFPKRVPLQQNRRQVFEKIAHRCPSGRQTVKVSANTSAATLEKLTSATRMPSLPFVKVAEQEDMKLALMLNVIDPTIGGVLIMGERGTGKSVAVRAMVDLLPEIEVVAEDAFNSHPTDTKLMGPDALQRHRNGEQLPMVRVKTPLVELPLGATEDRICGTINIEKALQEGVKAYEPGLLAKANRGILYVDEVNLLDDGLVDVVLDSSASGVNTVEREGIGIVHPAKFIMIGSGNPQEGEMRPQLLDRFGMSVNVATMQNIAARTRMVLDRIAFENDPDAFCVEAEEEQAALRAQLTAATEAAPGIAMARELKVTISEICSLLDVDGIRGDITTNKAARALAAFESKDTVTIDHVRRVIGLCLNHRLRKDPLETIDSGTKVALAFRRITDPQRAAKEEKAKKEAEAAAAKAAEKANKKAGAWGGLPGPKR